jgi:ABC-type multidrug transport system ATPase subunit
MITEIKCVDLSKRFGFEWIFKNLSFNFSTDKIYGIVGPNGAGKSSFLKIVSGFSTPTKGEISYTDTTGSKKQEQVFDRVTFCAPYIDLIEEMTVSEIITFQHNLRPFSDQNTVINEIKSFPFPGILAKRVIELSSGMKQRLKLALSILSDAEILLMDEPGSNLDDRANKWWKELLSKNSKNRIILIASNDAADLVMIHDKLDISVFKPVPKQK